MSSEQWTVSSKNAGSNEATTPGFGSDYSRHLLSCLLLLPLGLELLTAYCLLLTALERLRKSEVHLRSLQTINCGGTVEVVDAAGWTSLRN